MKLPPRDEDFNGEFKMDDVLDALITSLNNIKKRKNNIIKLNFEDSMFHFKLDIELAEI